MRWALLLHFYQPAGQRRDIVDAIAGQTYHPVLDAVLAANHGRITINLTGSLLELLHEFDHHDLIDKFAEAGRRGLVEYVGTSMFHAIMPMIAPEQARRQLDLHDEVSRRFLGDAYAPKGAFLPEMAYSPALAPILREAGFDWVILDELAYDGYVDHADNTAFHPIAGTDLKGVFRIHRLSDTLMSSGARTVDSFKRALATSLSDPGYLVTSLDGETFGHHRVGMTDLLSGLLADPELSMETVSELVASYPTGEPVPTVACTWASNEADLEDGIPFISWNDPTNPIQALQWELVREATDVMAVLPQDAPDYAARQRALDEGLSSDQFFWSAARPFWMIDHIENGAHLLRTAAGHSRRSQDLYQEIVGTAFEWQRNGHLTKLAKERDAILRIPFKERTLEAGGEGKATWDAFVGIMRREQSAAAEAGEYEAAIMWRDAIYKLEHKTDVYDGFHVVDILRHKLGDTAVDEELERYRAEYNRIRGGQSEQRSH